MIKVRYSPVYAMEVANNYWQNTSKTHASMDEGNGRLYITDTPNLNKRDKLNLSQLQILVTKIFRVYQLDARATQRAVDIIKERVL